MDDILAFIDGVVEVANEIINNINQVLDNIKFTIDIEKNNCINVLIVPS